MRQPISAFTSTTIAIVGIVLWSVSWFIGLSCIVLGISSGMYHWTKNRTWQYIDVWAIFLVFSAIGEHHLTGTFIGTLVIVPVLSYLHYQRIFRSWHMIGAVAFISIIIHLTFNFYMVTLLSVTYFALGMAIHRVTEKQSYWWHDVGHATWHILAAMGILILGL